QTSAKTTSPTVKPKPAASIQEALDRTLPLLGRADDGFLRQSGCVSCHNNSLFSMTIAAARKTGWPGMDAAADKQHKTIGPYIESWRDRALQGIGIPGGSDTVSYILVGLQAIGYAPDEATDALAYFLLGRQRPDGGWRIQSERPPLESSDIEVT